jgi:hypothetical protein
MNRWDRLKNATGRGERACHRQAPPGLRHASPGSDPSAGHSPNAPAKGCGPPTPLYRTRYLLLCIPLTRCPSFKSGSSSNPIRSTALRPQSAGALFSPNRRHHAVFRFIQSWTRDSREFVGTDSAIRKEAFGGVPIRELSQFLSGC